MSEQTNVELGLPPHLAPANTRVHLPSSEKPPLMVSDIQTAVVKYFSDLYKTKGIDPLKISDMRSESRNRGIARPRQIAMYLARTMTTQSFPEIGDRFDKDHSTIHHGCSKIRQILEDPTKKEHDDVIKHVTNIRTQLENDFSISIHCGTLELPKSKLLPPPG